MNVELSAIELGSQVYLREGGDPFGGIRDVRRSGRREIVIYVENCGRVCCLSRYHSERP